jgi:hypothetical protein
VYRNSGMEFLNPISYIQKLWNYVQSLSWSQHFDKLKKPFFRDAGNFSNIVFVFPLGCYS